MTRITEAEFASICNGIRDDRDSIIKHNPLGTHEEILLWMLLSCLISYLNLAEVETPCFNGTPDAKTYRKAILFVLNTRQSDDFYVATYLNELTK